jgi:hypothetical protein
MEKIEGLNAKILAGKLLDELAPAIQDANIFMGIQGIADATPIHVGKGSSRYSPIVQIVFTPTASATVCTTPGCVLTGTVALVVTRATVTITGRIGTKTNGRYRPITDMQPKRFGLPAEEMKVMQRLMMDPEGWEYAPPELIERLVRYAAKAKAKKPPRGVPGQAYRTGKWRG